MVTLVTRAVGDTAKGSPLTNNEVDQNFINLNTGKFERTGDTASYVDISTSATTTTGVGRLRWNDGDGTIDVGLKGGNVTLQLGQGSVQRIRNDTGSTLTDGQVVYITGAQGQRLTVALASNNAEGTSSKTVGVVTETISNGSEGFICTDGLVRGLDTSAIAEGSALWLGTGGGYTSTKPVAPAHAVLVGFCVRQHASSGSVFVKIQNGYELDELHDVLISAAINGHMLVYEDGLWKNKTPAQVRATLDVYNKAETSSVATDTAISMAIALG